MQPDTGGVQTSDVQSSGNNDGNAMFTQQPLNLANLASLQQQILARYPPIQYASYPTLLQGPNNAYSFFHPQSNHMGMMPGMIGGHNIPIQLTMNNQHPSLVHLHGLNPGLSMMPGMIVMSNPMMQHIQVNTDQSRTAAEQAQQQTETNPVIQASRPPLTPNVSAVSTTPTTSATVPMRPNRIYHDYVKDPSANEPDDEPGPGKDHSFPSKLHQILSDDEYSDFISWLPHGRSWKVRNQDEFEEKVIPLFFRHAKFASFMRQVNGWGFRRMPTGPDRNSYYHEMFLRGYPHLCAKMRRPVEKIRSTSEPKAHPNFNDSKLFARIPHEKKREHSIPSVSTSPSNNGTGSDSTGRNDSSCSDQGESSRVNIYGMGSNLYNLGESGNPYGGYNSSGSEPGSNMIYGSVGSYQDSHINRSGGSDEGSTSGDNSESISTGSDTGGENSSKSPPPVGSSVS